MSQLLRFPMVAPRHSILACFCALAIASSIGCGGKGTGKVEYSVSAQQNYAKGLDELKEEDWIAAAKYFSFVKARFPYSKYAVLAELRLADAEFGAGHYLQAIDSYKLFIKFHPTHEMVVNGYAAFRIGGAYYEMLPGDWFMLPPSYEKDQSATVDAHRELATFIKKHPKSAFIADAEKMKQRCAQKLAQHEWYVARFYWDKQRPMGTVLRLRHLLDRYPGAGFDADALWLLGRAYVRVGMKDRARTTWERLLKEFPRHESADDARGELKRLTG